MQGNRGDDREGLQNKTGNKTQKLQIMTCAFFVRTLSSQLNCSMEEMAILFNCLTIQEALCAKKMNFRHIVNFVAKVTNLIRGGKSSFNYRKFVVFLDEVITVYGDSQMLTEIRWMSFLEKLFCTVY